MIRLRLEQVLAENGRTMYWLSKETKIAYSTVHDYAKNKVQNVDLSVLNRICAALDAAPGDLLEYIPDKAKRGK